MIVMPDRIPPHKQAEDLASSEDRLNMCRLAFADIPCVEISDWELKQEGKSYSVITLRHLKEIYPHDKLFFIMGSDMLLSFEEWYQYKEILSLSALICVARSHEDIDHIEVKAKQLKAEGGERDNHNVKTDPFECLQLRYVKCSKNVDCSCYLGENVVQYSGQKNLYNQRFSKWQIKKQ